MAFNLDRIHIRALTTVSSSGVSISSKLNSWYISGFADAESCFMISIYKNKAQKQGFAVKAIFAIGLHEKDRLLLESIRSFFGDAGSINKGGENLIQYYVTSIKDLKVIIDHFDKFPLITQKRADFELFKQVVDLMSRKQHLTKEGLQQIINLRASINLGLSDELKAAFPKYKPANRPVFDFKGIPDPN